MNLVTEVENEGAVDQQSLGKSRQRNAVEQGGITSHAVISVPEGMGQSTGW